MSNATLDNNFPASWATLGTTITSAKCPLKSFGRRHARKPAFLRWLWAVRDSPVVQDLWPYRSYLGGIKQVENCCKHKSCIYAYIVVLYWWYGIHFSCIWTWEFEQGMARGLAMGPAKSHYQLSGLEGWTWGSQPLTVLYLPGSPLRHGPLSFRSDSKAMDQSLPSTTGFSSSLDQTANRVPGIQPCVVCRWFCSAETSSLLLHDEPLYVCVHYLYH